MVVTYRDNEECENCERERQKVTSLEKVIAKLKAEYTIPYKVSNRAAPCVFCGCALDYQYGCNVRAREYGSWVCRGSWLKNLFKKTKCPTAMHYHVNCKRCDASWIEIVEELLK